MGVGLGYRIVGILLLGILSQAKVNAEQLKQYNETCVGESVPEDSDHEVKVEQTTEEVVLSNSTSTYVEECDTSKDLKCQEGFCLPFCPVSSNYDKKKQKCVLDLMPSYFSSIYTSAQSYPCSKCTDNAECIVPHPLESENPGRTYCTCVNGTVPIGYQLCSERKKFQESCVQDSQCIPESMQSNEAGTLRCIDSICQCPIVDNNNFTGTYDPLHGKCVSYPGEPCGYRERYSYYYTSPAALCVGNSHCSDEDSYSYYSTVRRCKCQYSASVSDDSKSCLAGHGSDCGSTKPCDYRKRLKCIAGDCACASPKYQKYENGVCVYKLGSLCPKISNSSEETPPLCGVNKQCLDGKCQCNPGYSPNNDTTKCYQDYNETCFSYHYSDCNTEQGLSCVYNKCVCSDTTDTFPIFYHFDSINRTCDMSRPIENVIDRILQNTTHSEHYTSSSYNEKPGVLLYLQFALLFVIYVTLF